MDIVDMPFNQEFDPGTLLKISEKSLFAAGKIIEVLYSFNNNMGYWISVYELNGYKYRMIPHNIVNVVGLNKTKYENTHIDECPVCFETCDVISFPCHPNHVICIDCKHKYGKNRCIICRSI